MFANHRYVSIATQKRDNSWVWTPVWMAAAEPGGVFYLFSAGAAGKVKRIRNYPGIQVAPCTASGKITGDVQHANAWLENDEAVAQAAYAALRQKYGLQMWVLDFFSRLSGNFHKRQLVGFKLTEAEQ
jgi:PPOX class probable F420-dependent enzyme